MLIQEKMMSGKFLLDSKNDHLSGLHGTHHLPHAHHTAHPQQLLLPTLKADMYSAYAYHQQLHQQHHHHHHHQPHQLHHLHHSPGSEVLDLSRRYETTITPPPKTPSPYSHVAHSTGSPINSPIHSQPPALFHPAMITPSTGALPTPSNAAALGGITVPTNLLYSAHAEQQQAQTGLALTAGLAASLYPSLYYAGGGLKQETPPCTSPTSSSNLPTSTNQLLQNFASAAAAAAANASMSVDLAEQQQRSPVSSKSRPFNHQRHSPTLGLNASPSTTATAGLDANKTTRPFKAFPRDPLVIAANFAATDVLLDNPHVERYTEYRKRVLEQIHNSNGGSRTVTNPKMRRTNTRHSSIDHSHNSNTNSETEERTGADESSDCDSNAGNFEKMTTSTISNSSTGSNHELISSSDTNNNQGSLNASGYGGSGSFLGGSMVKDAAYFERRRKNNAAAKKSRDRRRIKEDEIAIRAAYLERQNIELLCQIDALKAQLATFTSKIVT